MIENVIAGQTPSLLSAQKANELINALNALQNISIVYGENFSASYGSNGVVLTIPEPPEPTEITEVQESTGGGTITGEEYTMYVCENGTPVQKTFYIS